MYMVATAADVNVMAAKVKDTGGVYFVTALGGLFAPYWDPSATGLLIGMYLLEFAKVRVLISSSQVFRPTQRPRTSHVLLWRQTRS